jgi:hypothetical protein
MRTVIDLEGAFTLLEGEADDYLLGNAHDPEPTAAIDLPARQSASRRPRRGRAASVASALVAAAAVAALAVAMGPSGSSGHGGDAAGGGPTAVNDGYANRLITVTVDPSLGLTVLEIATSDGETGLELFSAQQHFSVTLVASGADVTPGLEPVDVNGETGYYDDGSRPQFVEPARDSSTPAPPTPTPPSSRWVPSVVWPYGRGAWAFVVGEGVGGDKTELIKVARGIRFGAATSIRSAVALDAAPAGTHLAHIDAMYHEPGDNPPYDLTGARWYTSVDYALDDPAGSSGAVDRSGCRSGCGVHIEATSVDTLSNDGGESTTVGGHPAKWYPDHMRGGTALAVDVGNGRYLNLSAAGYSKDQLSALAESVTLTDYPTDPTKWFQARTALP